MNVVDLSAFRTIEVDNEKFLRAVFGTEWERAHVCAFAEDPHDLDALGLRSYWAGGPAWRLLPGMTVGENQYFTISLFSGSRRRKTDCEATYCVVLDDVGSPGDGSSTAKVPWDRVKLPPSWVLETSPGNYQVGYVLGTPDTRAGKISGLLEALVASGLCSGGKDPGMKGVTRYVRLPGGTNRKKAYGAGGFRHRMVLWNPGARVSAEQIADAYGVRSAFDAAPDALGGYAGGKGVVLPASEDVWLGTLSRAGVVKQELSAGVWDIECPFVEEHTLRADSGCAYLGDGGFKCHHGHCEAKPSGEFQEKVREMFPEEYGAARREMLDAQFGDLGGSRDPFEGMREGVEDQVEKLARVAAAGKFGSAFDFRDLAGIKPEDVLRQAWLLKKMFPSEGLAVLYGAPKTGKSFIAFDMACRIALGDAWFGHKVKREGFVVYVSAEGGALSAKARALAWRKRHKEDPDLVVIPQKVILGRDMSELDERLLVTFIAEQEALRGKPCSLIVFDTLNRTMSGDENATVDMTEYVHAIDRIWQKIGCLALVVHHTGQNGKMRGNTALPGAVVAKIRVDRDKEVAGAPGTILLEDAKDAEDGVRFGFELKSEILGYDEDGEEITSMTIVQCKPPSKTVKLGAREQEIVDALTDIGGHDEGTAVNPDALWKHVKMQYQNTQKRRNQFDARVDSLLGKGVFQKEASGGLWVAK